MEDSMIEIGEIETNDTTASPEAPTLLVVQSSTRGWLLATLPPSLILLGGLAIASHQMRPDPAAYAPVGNSFTPPSRTLAVPTTRIATVEPGELSVRVEAPPALESAAPPPPTRVAEPAPEVVVAAEPVPPLVETDDIDFAPAMPPAPSLEPSPSQIVWDDIDAEAREAQRKKHAAEQLRGQVFAQNEQVAEERLNRARMTSANDRGQFLADLVTLLRRHGRKAGPYISELTGLYGRNLPPELQKAAEATRAKLDAANADARARVTFYRRLGLSETCILDELSHQFTQAIGSRKGPRNREEVLYFAARLLVTVPLESAATQAAKAPAP
jgi:hypothetical protein